MKLVAYELKWYLHKAKFKILFSFMLLFFFFYLASRNFGSGNSTFIVYLNHFMTGPRKADLLNANYEIPIAWFLFYALFLFLVASFFDSKNTAMVAHQIGSQLKRSKVIFSKLMALFLFAVLYYFFFVIGAFFITNEVIPFTDLGFLLFSFTILFVLCGFVVIYFLLFIMSYAFMALFIGFSLLLIQSKFYFYWSPLNMSLSTRFSDYHFQQIVIIFGLTMIFIAVILLLARQIFIKKDLL